MSLIYDLHSHSTASDGSLRPKALLARAKSQNIDVLALTDHDNTAGLEEAEAAAGDLGVKLVPGVEISVTWNKTTVHVLGLGIRPQNRELLFRVPLISPKAKVGVHMSPIPRCGLAPIAIENKYPKVF